MIPAVATMAYCSPQVVTAVSVVNTRTDLQKPALQRIGVQRSRSRLSSIRAQAQPRDKSEHYVDYEGTKSVFPAEACEDTGEDCDAEGVFAEVKPTATATKAPESQQSGPDREYEDYAGERTVFPGEACDELGGDFCDPKFQEGVFPEKVPASKN